jgi:hypothetical protein
MLALGAYFYVAAAIVKTFQYKYGSIPIPRPVGRVICIFLGTFCVAVAFVLAWRA